MYFARQEARGLSVVEVEQFRKARQVLGQVDHLGAGDDVGDAPCEPSEGGECAFQAGRDCVCAELRHFVQPLVQVGEVFREDLSLQVPSDPHRGEVGAREDERGPVQRAGGSRGVAKCGCPSQLSDARVCTCPPVSRNSQY